MSDHTTQDQANPKPAESRARHIRIPDDVWLPACAKANAEGERVSVVVRRLLREYVSD